MNWYYANGGQRLGPIDAARFTELAQGGVIHDATMVWHDGMADWQTYAAYRGAAPPQLSVRYAGFWIRFVARVIDAVILAVVTTVLRAPLFLALGLSRAAVLSPMLVPGMIGVFVLSLMINTVVGVAYEAYFVSTRGATPGKMALGLKIVRAGGGGISPALAIGRYFSQLLSGIILGIGYIMAAFDAEKRSLHDRLCETRVIRTN